LEVVLSHTTVTISETEKRCTFTLNIIFLHKIGGKVDNDKMEEFQQREQQDNPESRRQ